MARPLRVEYEGAWYHVMNRGAARKNIFDHNGHRELFLKLLGKIHERFKIEIHAYCLMSNHYHLLVKTPLANLHKCMRQLNGVYTQIYNRGKNVDGALFRGRYKAILVDADDYLLRLSRYIHLNPVQAGMCATPDRYRWSSCLYYLTKINRPAWLFCEETLSRFGSTQRAFKYKRFLEEGVDAELLQFYQRSKISPMLGSEKFIKHINAKYLKFDEIDREISEFKSITKIIVPTVMQVIQAVARYYDVDVEEVRGTKRGRHNDIKSLAMYLANKICQVSMREVGNEFNAITRNGVASNNRRFASRLEIDKNARADLKAIQDLIKNRG